MQFENFEEILEFIGPFGRYQIWFALFHQFAALTLCGNFAFMSFGMIEPFLFCDNINLINSNNQLVMHGFDLFETKLHNFAYLNNNSTTTANFYQLILTNNDRKINCTALNHCQSNQTKSISNRFYSVVQEWNLYCDNNYIPHFILTMQMIGALCGTQIAGYLADNFGRKIIYLVCLICLILTGLFSAIFASSWATFTVFRFLTGFLVQSCILTGFIWSMELTDTTHNVKMNLCHVWQFAYILVPLIAFVCQRWRFYMLVINLISLPLIFAFLFYFYESPRWLIQSKQYVKAAKILSKIAKQNNKALKILPGSLAYINVDIDDHHYTVFHLCLSKTLIKNSSLLFMIFFSAELISTTFIYNIRNMGGNPFVDLATYGAMRSWIPFAIYLMDRKYQWFGRRMLFIVTILLVLTCFSIVCLLLLIRSSVIDNNLHIASTAFAVMGAVFAAALWAVVGQYQVELFPTVIRNIAGAFSSIGAQAGGIVMPQLLYLDNFWPGLPYLCIVVIAVLNLAVGYCFLPETKGKNLPDILHCNNDMLSSNQSLMNTPKEIFPLVTNEENS